jgi:hypothetical protein
MEEIIKVRIVADASELTGAATQSGAALQTFGAKTKQVQQSLRNIDTSIKPVTASLTNLNKKQGDATQSLVNLSRVAQDAPYGFIGIANNLNPLLESFQRLKAETGSTGRALKSLAAGLGGAGGIGLALGVASSLLVVFGDKLFSSGAAAKKAEEAISEYKKSVASAFTQVAQEAAKVEVLVTALKRENLSRAQRVEAIKQLQQIAPAYFNTLSAEKFNIDKLTAAYSNYTAGLRSAAEGKVLEKQLEGIIDKRLQLEKKLNPAQFIIDENGNKILNYRLATQDQLNDEQREYNNLLKAEQTIANRLAQIKPRDLVTPLKTTTAKAEKLKIKPDRIELEAPITSFDLPFPINLSTAARVHIEALKLEVEEKARNQFADDFNKVMGLNKIVFRPIVSAEDISLGKDIDKLKGEFADAGFKLPPLDLSDVLPEDRLKTIKEKYSAALQQMQAEAAFINEALSPAFTDMFTAIENGGNALEAFTTSLASTMKTLIANLISQALTALFISALIPGGGNFLSIFSKLSGGVLGFNKGGKVPGSGDRDTVPALLTPGEIVLTKEQAKQFESALQGNKMLSKSSLADAVNKSFSTDISNGLQSLNIPKSAFGVSVFAVPAPKPTSTSMADNSAIKLSGDFKIRGGDMALQASRIKRKQRRSS